MTPEYIDFLNRFRAKTNGELLGTHTQLVADNMGVILNFLSDKTRSSLVRLFSDVYYDWMLAAAYVHDIGKNIRFDATHHVSGIVVLRRILEASHSTAIVDNLLFMIASHHGTVQANTAFAKRPWLPQHDTLYEHLAPCLSLLNTPTTSPLSGTGSRDMKVAIGILMLADWTASQQWRMCDKPNVIFNDCQNITFDVPGNIIHCPDLSDTSFLGREKSKSPKYVANLLTLEFGQHNVP